MRASGSSTRPWPGWAHALLGALVFGAGLLLVILIQQQTTARKAWPLMQATFKRLSTDEGARDFWANNPGIHDDYSGDAEEFLGEVRAWRPRIGELASNEPHSQPRSSWFRSTSPWHIWAVAQGAEGGWMQFQLQRPGPFESPEGEGFTMVHFASDWDALREVRIARRERRFGAQWQKVRRIADQVASAEGARQLWHAEWALHQAYPSVEAFEQEAARARPVLNHLPKSAREASEGLALKRIRNPFMDRLDMSWKDPEGRAVELVWENGALVGFKRLG